MIHLFSSWTHEYAPLAEATFFNNKVRYAKLHGYETKHVIHENAIALQWQRVRHWLLMLCNIPEGDWLWCTGSDLQITNPSYKLEDYILDPTAEFIGCMDRQVVFGDCVFLKSCKHTKDMLKWIIEHSNEHCNEQTAFATYLSKSQHFEYFCDKVGTDYDKSEFYHRAESILNTSPVKVKIFDILKPKKITGDLDWIHDAEWLVPPYYAWKPDSFSVHIGGKPLRFRLGVLKLLEKDIIWPNPRKTCGD